MPLKSHHQIGAVVMYCAISNAQGSAFPTFDWIGSFIFEMGENIDSSENRNYLKCENVKHANIRSQCYLSGS